MPLSARGSKAALSKENAPLNVPLSARGSKAALSKENAPLNMPLSARGGKKEGLRLRPTKAKGEAFVV